MKDISLSNFSVFGFHDFLFTFGRAWDVRFDPNDQSIDAVEQRPSADVGTTWLNGTPWNNGNDMSEQMRTDANRCGQIRWEQL